MSDAGAAVFLTNDARIGQYWRAVGCGNVAAPCRRMCVEAHRPRPPRRTSFMTRVNLLNKRVCLEDNERGVRMAMTAPINVSILAALVLSGCIGNIGPAKGTLRGTAPAHPRRGPQARPATGTRHRHRHRGNRRQRRCRQLPSRNGRHDGRGPVQFDRPRPLAAAPPDDVRIQQHDPRSARRHDQPGQRAAGAGRQQAEPLRQRRRRAVAHRRAGREVPDRGGGDRGARDRERDRARQAAQLRDAT